MPSNSIPGLDTIVLTVYQGYLDIIVQTGPILFQHRLGQEEVFLDNTLADVYILTFLASSGQ